MTTLNYKDELIANLKDKEYRDAFVASHIKNGIPFQIRTLREQIPYTQEQLAQVAGKQQAAICRLENPHYGNFTLATLKELASVFDVALVVKFVPFSELVEWDLKLSADSLKVLSFENDPYFQVKENKMLSSEDQRQYTTIPITEVVKKEILTSGEAETASFADLPSVVSLAA